MPDTVTIAPRVRRAIKQSLFAVGYYHQRLSATAFPGLAVLCYHGIRTSDDDSIPFSDLHVTKATFEQHCRLLANVCDPISLSELRDARLGRELPPRPVIVTFDDGYRGVLDHALPILERYGIPAAVFVSAAPVLERRHFWFDALCRRQGEAAVLKARALPYHEWRALMEETASALDENESHRPLTSPELQRLAASHLIEIGAHTMTHPTLALAPVEDQQREISGCRTALERVLGKPVNAFAYPYGNVSEDYTSDSVSLVRDARFDLGFTTCESFATVEGDPLQIPRFMILDTVGDVELAHRLVHSWHAAAS